MLRYQNTVVEINGTANIHATKASLSQAASISPRRVLAPNMPDGFGVNGERDIQLNLEFPIILATSYPPQNGFGYLHTLTGDESFTVAVGETTYPVCFLESLSLNISPNAPIMGSASLRLFNDANQATPATGEPFSILDLKNRVAYGHNVSVFATGLGMDDNINSIAYSVACQRSYSFPMWAAGENRIVGFLDGVEKKLVIQHRNMNNEIPYTGGTGNIGVVISGESTSIDLLFADPNLATTNIDHSHEAGKNGMASISLTQIVY